jgi:hypothetical protein
MDEANGFGMQLRRADVTVDGLATPRGLAAQLRLGFEPAARRWMRWRTAVGAEAEGVDEAGAYPLITEERWASYTAGGVHHATYWVREMPRQQVGPAWMHALMLETGSERTVSWVAEPLAPRQAQQHVVRQQVEDVATEDFKARRGFLVTRREQAEHASAERRESELVAGHGLYRYNVYVTVSGASAEELEERCLRLEQGSARSMLELQRLVGQQAEAFTFALPLGRGL